MVQAYWVGLLTSSSIIGILIKMFGEVLKFIEMFAARRFWVKSELAEKLLLLLCLSHKHWNISHNDWIVSSWDWRHHCTAYSDQILLLEDCCSHAAELWLSVTDFHCKKLEKHKSCLHKSEVYLPIWGLKTSCRPFLLFYPWTWIG